MKNLLTLTSAAVASGLLFASQASAGLLYATSFESPTFTAATPLSGQDGWTATTAGGQPVMTVTAGAALAHVGSQFVLYNARDTQTAVNEVKFAWKPINVSAVDMQATPILSATVFAAIQTGTNADVDLAGLDLYNIAGARIARIDFSSDGVISVYNAAGLVGASAAGTATPNAYHKLGIVVDYSTGAVTYSYENTVIATATTTTATTFGDADLYTFHVADDTTSNVGNRIAFDDLVIVTVPEPTTLSLLGVSALAMLRRRRAR